MKAICCNYTSTITYALYLLTYLLTHGAEPFLRSHQLASH
jgi:hypothetical protein